MFNYGRYEIVNIAKENGFRSETLEKVLRLVDVLNFINSNSKLSPYLVLKGGTAINFTIFNLPRLSVDIDLDFSLSGTKEEMLEKRKEITAIIRRYMEINKYTFSESTKNRHALDSFVFNYINIFGNKDNLKIEINYMNRVHIYKPIARNVLIPFVRSFCVLTLNKFELFGSKIKALIERCTIRDVYDVYYMLKEKVVDENEYGLLKKCVIFYMVIGQTTDRTFEEVLTDFYNKITIYMTNKIPQYLSATLKNEDKFDMKEAVGIVKDFINKLMVLEKNEKEFVKTFYEGKKYKPELLFENDDIVNRISKHPMALWKISNY